ncbi:MAG: AmmeMemoRadiSam system protein A [Coriobacteriia bacterium]|nr:AmmeMemoRadiSam system protein A [Coriobacteriia bacterium]
MSFDILGVIAPHPPIMVPAVGRDRAAATEASARALRSAAGLLERFAPDTVVVISPHSPGFADAFMVSDEPTREGDLAQFGAPASRRSVPGDQALARAILDAAVEAGIPAVGRSSVHAGRNDELDHGVLVPMAFLDPDGRYPTVDIAFSLLPASTHAEFGSLIRLAADRIGRRVAFVASGDCSHRLSRSAPAGFSPRAHLFDELLLAAVAAGDFAALAAIDEELREEAGECGWRSFVTMGGFLSGTDAAAKALVYEAPWGVGYLTAVFAPEGELAGLPDVATAGDPAGAKGGSKGDAESELVTLARATVEQYIRGGSVPEAGPLRDPALPLRAGAFVTLYENGELRGCIGTIAPTQPTLAAEIVHNAVQAATEDPRFPPVTEEELDSLDIKVDVLHEPEPIHLTADLDPAVYGVIVTSGWKRGLLLPDLEGVDSVDAQLAIAMRKGGIAPGEHVSIQRFKVDRYA